MCTRREQEPVSTANKPSWSLAGWKNVCDFLVSSCQPRSVLTGLSELCHSSLDNAHPHSALSGHLPETKPRAKYSRWAKTKRKRTKWNKTRWNEMRTKHIKRLLKFHKTTRIFVIFHSKFTTTSAGGGDEARFFRVLEPSKLMKWPTWHVVLWSFVMCLESGFIDQDLRLIMTYQASSLFTRFVPTTRPAIGSGTSTFVHGLVLEFCKTGG